MSNDSLEEGEIHPAAHNAYAYIKESLGLRPMLVEAMASCALSGNRMAEVCLGTLERLRNDDPVSDRYILGLAWMLKEMEESE